MHKLLTVFVICILLTAFFSCASADTELQISPILEVYGISSERCIREASENETLGSNEYFSFCFHVTNTSGRDISFSSAYARIDNGKKLGWSSDSLRSGETSRFHIFYSNMQYVEPGLHKVDFYMDDKLVTTATFSIPRDWSETMRLSGILGAKVGSAQGRAPYLVFYPSFGDKEKRYSEYSVDFEIDLAPECTYLSLLHWNFDWSGLKKNYKKIYNDYGILGGYCGLQVWNDGTHAIIMTVWDAFCVDKKGNTTVHKATLLKPTGRAAQANKGDSEGSFVHILYEYDWKTNHPYRLLIQQSTAEATGNMSVAMWLCDLETMNWDLIAEFDTGLPYTCLTGVGGFLEDYGRSEAPRSVELSNFRIRAYGSNKWTGAKKIKMTVNNSMNADAMNYTGSYNFGANDTTVWMITSGRSGLCTLPNSGTKLTVSQCDTSSPY